MAETNEPTEPHGVHDQLMLTPLTRRSQPATERPPLPPEIEAQFNQLLQNVQVLTAHFLGETAAPPVESLKERMARRVKKFHRAGGDERAAAAVPGDESSQEPLSEATSESPAAADDIPDPLALNKNIAWPRQANPGGWIDPDAGTRRWWNSRPGLGLWIGAQVLVLVVLVVGYLIGRNASTPQPRVGNKAGRTAVDLFGQPELTEQAFQTANEALRAEHSNDPEGARKIYETALTKRVNLPGINYRLALLAVQRNDRLEAEQRLERSTLDGEYVADCCYILARLAADKGDLEETANQLQRATRAEPLNGKFFFYWAESLRRQGKPQAAVTAFEEALDRPYTSENGDLYLFKERLAKVEYGHDDAFDAELASHLKQVPVAGEWLLLAAAQDIDRQNYAAAAEYLRMAADRLPAALYSNLTHDYFFQAQGKQPELAPLLNRTVPPIVSTAGPTVLDPGAWSPERGDPATWPSATNTSAP